MKKTIVFFVISSAAILMHTTLFAQKHPIAFATASDIALVKKSIPTNPLLKESFDEIKKSVDANLGKDIDVPVPKHAGGGYTHDNTRIIIPSCLIVVCFIS